MSGVTDHIADIYASEGRPAGMSEKEELTSEKQKRLLQRLVEELSRENSQFYYQPTSEIAFALRRRIDDKTGLTAEEVTLLEPLSRYDIQVLLSLH